MKSREPGPAPPPQSDPGSHLFATELRITGRKTPGAETGRNGLHWIIAGLIILLLVILAVVGFIEHTPANSAGYAAGLILSNVHVAEATNFAGDQLTYIEGAASNRGDRTVTAITVRVLFASNTGDPPQIEQVPLSLVRTRQPFVETEPVSAAPFTPGSTRDFRLTFDDVSPDWNRKPPAIWVEHFVSSPSSHP